MALRFPSNHFGTSGSIGDGIAPAGSENYSYRMIELSIRFARQLLLPFCIRTFDDAVEAY